MMPTEITINLDDLILRAILIGELMGASFVDGDNHIINLVSSGKTNPELNLAGEAVDKIMEVWGQ